MQNINFHIDPTTRSNHKRSFDFQRRNHITQKKFDNKVVPTRWVAPQFETFDAYMSDLQSKMAALFNERKGLFLPDEERGFDIHIETTPHNYGILALYNGIDRRTGNVKFTYRLDDLVCAFYYPEEQGRKENRDDHRKGDTRRKGGENMSLGCSYPYDNQRKLAELALGYCCKKSCAAAVTVGG